ncbi:hypothetical protein A2801_04205 [Candidatus Woesebacteria bacterium RIFCSPHIGHO2_01_FULL_41_10]|uniref:Uncharacterized protein n=1 Tax=Candidatus Woesebacteria bacterium RIFCSPHIGHO2_01_FULL_41_10 TaxID=1802500 RepID=A0A1F7YLM8_9BACT|nr:MAG: hypothetical protein A2801_04205 [Candidatus Woesebacteria bacterium RIFCSPHIGHO2_01_FULL_41_10]
MFIAFIILAPFILYAFVCEREKNILEQEVSELRAQIPPEPQKRITLDSINKLPPLVREYLKSAGVIDAKPIQLTALTQTGAIRQSTATPWMYFDSTQYYVTAIPAFIWSAVVRFLYILPVHGKDSLIHRRGHMNIRIAGLFPLVNESGTEVDQGNMLRYLSEMPWFPTAFLSDNITWKSVGTDKVEATLKLGSSRVSGVFTFNGKHKITLFETERYFTKGKGLYSLEKWKTTFENYKQIQSFTIPTKGSAIWQFDQGELEYVRMKVIEAKYE